MVFNSTFMIEVSGFPLGICQTLQFFIKGILTFIFICGYPLNSIIFGYAYLSVGILYITTLIALGINVNKSLLTLLNPSNI